MTKTRKNQIASRADATRDPGAAPEQVGPTVDANKDAAAPIAPAPKPPSKQQKLAALVVRDAGANLDQGIGATGGLPHTIRAALTGLKKKGNVIRSDKVEGVRTYRGIAPA